MLNPNPGTLGGIVVVVVVIVVVVEVEVELLLLVLVYESSCFYLTTMQEQADAAITDNRCTYEDEHG